MNLREWALAQGLHPQTAYKWFREGKLPVPATRVGPRTVLVNMDAATAPAASGGVGLYARVSSHDQKPDLERQAARLSTRPAQAGLRVVRVKSALTASGRRLVVPDAGEVDNDLVPDMVEVLTSFCVRLYGRRSARNRAERALACAARDPA